MKKNTVQIIIISLIIGVVGFFVGMKYDQSRITNRFVANQGEINENVQGRNFQRDSGMMGKRNGMSSNRPVSGEILSVDDKSMTVKLQDGSSKIVLFSDTTTIAKSTTGSKTDLKSGERVTAFGASNSDGSITAQNISLGDSFFQRGMMQSVTTTPKVNQ